MPSKDEDQRKAVEQEIEEGIRKARYAGVALPPEAEAFAKGSLRFPSTEK